MTFLSAFTRRFKEIAANTNVRRPVTPAATPVLPPTIKAANEAINELPPVTHPPSRVSQAGIDLLHHFEGFHRDIGSGKVRAYPDPATGGEPWTIGYGSTGRDPFNGGRIGTNTIWTHEQARQRFRDHLRQFEREVSAVITAPTTQGQYDAIVSLAYNVGSANVAKSTLLRLHNAGNHAAAQKQFVRWNRAAGKVMAGLTRRRQAEACLYAGEPWQ
jgi:GH24 family phage-related lysozyme (muramidase)